MMMGVLLKMVAEVIVQKAGLRKRRAGAAKIIKRVAVPMTVTWQSKSQSRWFIFCNVM